MKYSEYLLKKVVPAYFMVVTFLNLGIFLMESIFEPGRVVSVDVLLSPLIFAAIGVLPMLITYRKGEKRFRQVLLLEALRLTALVVIIIGTGSVLCAIQNVKEGIAVFLTIVLIYFLILLIQWKAEARLAKQLTEALEKLEDI